MKNTNKIIDSNSVHGTSLREQKGKKFACKNGAFFLDRDGVIIVEKNYLSRPADVELIPLVAEALTIIRNAGYKIIVVSNQAGVARGFFREEDVLKVNNKIQELLKAKGTYIDAFYYCPHHPDGIEKKYALECQCRKPLPGMLLRGAKDFNIDMANSCMIGDKISDIEAGINAKCNLSVLVTTGYGLKYKSSYDTDLVKADLFEAVQFALKRLKNR